MFNEYLLLLFCYMRQSSKEGIVTESNGALIRLSTGCCEPTGGAPNITLEIRTGFLEQVIPRTKR